MSKIFKYTLAFFAIVFLLFAGLGLAFPSVSYEISTEINAPDSLVFSALSDHANREEWIGNLKNMEKISGADNAIGSKYRYSMADDKNTIELTETILRYEPDSVYAFSLQTRVLTNYVTVHFRPDGNQTQVIYHTRVKGEGLFMRSMLVIIRPFLKDKIEADLQRLKQEVESI